MFNLAYIKQQQQLIDELVSLIYNCIQQQLSIFEYQRFSDGHQFLVLLLFLVFLAFLYIHYNHDVVNELYFLVFVELQFLVDTIFNTRNNDFFFRDVNLIWQLVLDKFYFSVLAFFDNWVFYVDSFFRDVKYYLIQQLFL
ncbi:hypothetical protein DIS24_g34 [Lasiodiplodia hormozganensis]|uniref:Transmembrane protein n=1 Tax=Lasiodiplodia hormozganensis TaxID=869390 RepID=A0AA40D7X6_9PEZI|nr:hypothetical protein DIS24_g34 [Lasiodiplodia hormozganensis]